MTSSIELAEMATPDRPLPPAIAEELAVRSGGHPLLLRELARAAARGEDPDELPSTVEELAASQIDQLPLAQRSLLRRPQYSAMSSPRTCFADDQGRCAREVGNRTTRRAVRPHCLDRSPAPLPSPHSSGSRVRRPAL